MKGKKLNILFLSSWYPSKVHSTLGNFVARHAESVATIHNVHVLYVKSSSQIDTSMSIEEDTIYGVRTTIVYFKKGLINPVNKWRAFKAGIAHLQKKGEFHFDVIHHNVIWNDGWQALWLKRKFGIPYIISEHWTGYDNARKVERPFFLKQLATRVARNATVLCPVSLDLQNKMQQFGLDGKYEVVPNVVDTDLFTWQAKDDSVIRFLHVSSLVDEHKNITGILQAWKQVMDEGNNNASSRSIHLTIGGDGPWEKWAKVASDMDINPGSITFFGEKDPPGIAALMSESHCLILFSNYENLPVVILEAMACGMAVISTSVGGISEHISAQRGYLITKNDVEQLNRSILRFRNEFQEFDRLALREYAVSHFSVQAVAEKFDAVYKEVLS